jgi:prepilin-type N-terminal cleavage/methylation domain-containing protein
MKKGFTLIELAIVLVIIGLLMGAIFKGMGLIDNAKQKNLVKEADSIQAAALTYYDKFGFLPGDDPDAYDHVGIRATTANGNGNIDSFTTQCQDNSTKESCLFWEELRAADLLTGSGTTNPHSAYGGPVGVGYTRPNRYAPYGNWIEFANIPGNVAKNIDTKYDDGNWRGGDIQANTGYNRSKVNLYFKLQ